MSGAKFRITDLKTGRKFDVEAIQPRHEHRTEFGDSLYDKCTGAIKEAESEISEATHDNIMYASNPLDAIDKLLKG